MTKKESLTSLVIVTIVGLQVLAAFKIPPRPIGRQYFLWPFINYAMYSPPHYEGDAVERPVAYGVLPDSTEVEMEPSDLGVGFWKYDRGIIRSLANDDTSDVENWARVYAERNGERLTAVRLYHRPVILTRSGSRPGDPVLVKEFQVDTLTER